MPFKLTFEPKLALAVFKYSGDVTIEEVIQAEKQLHNSPDLHRCNKCLNIYNTDVVVQWTTDDFFHYRIKLEKQTEHLNKIRVAVVTESPLIFGMHRMYEVLNKAKSVYADHMTFYNLDKACDWLGIGTGNLVT